VGFIGSALDVRGSSSNPVACAPTGKMEALFADKVKKILNPTPDNIQRPGL
jgi:hypothetical protein